MDNLYQFRMIDFHCLIHPVQKRDVFVLEHEKCNVHFVQGCLQNIGKGRREGFEHGCSKYVSFYDDDDQVLTPPIDEIIGILEADESLDAVCTDEMTVTDGVLTARKRAVKNGLILNLNQVRFVHHLVVVRRSSIKPFLHILDQCPDLCEFVLWGSMIQAGCKFRWLSEFGYVWNIHKGCAKSMHIPTNDFVKNKMKEIGLFV